MRRPVTLQGAFELLSSSAELEQAQAELSELLATDERVAIREHFTNRFLKQPEEQLGGVRETIGNYLQYFITSEVAACLACSEFLLKRAS